MALPRNNRTKPDYCLGAGLTNSKGDADTVGSSLDHLIGTWTAVEADKMDSALEASTILTSGLQES